MSEWRETTFGALGKIFDGPHATPERIDEGPYFLSISSLKDGRLDISESDHVSADDFARWTKRVEPEEGDLLFSYETRLGDAALMPAGVQACLGRRMALLRPDRSIIDPRFLLYMYLAPAFQATIEQNTIQGATVNRIPLKTMGEWTVRIPVLGVQRAIADVLSALDDKIATNTKLASAADVYLSALFEGALRNGRGEVRLRDIAEVNPEKRSPSDGFLRYIDIASVAVGSFEFPKETSWADAPGRARRGVRSGDIVWSTVRPNRRSHAIILEEEPSLVVSTGLAVIRSVEWPWVYEAMRRPEFTAYLETVAEGSAYPAVRADKFLDAKLPVVDSAAREVFNELAAAVRSAVSLKMVENRRLAATRDALLPALMSGRLAVRDAEAAVERAVDSGAIEPEPVASGALW
ncbi:restriction endonuclease subunit S [Promicromonospora sp. NPDC023987]|uniref:restriction endonuclease subunit S n=1 Tax=Promicromonospora sp. NPDC023987 TaxID=3155360 RepID=UPI00340CD1BE